MVDVVSIVDFDNVVAALEAKIVLLNGRVTVLEASGGAGIPSEVKAAVNVVADYISK